MPLGAPGSGGGAALGAGEERLEGGEAQVRRRRGRGGVKHRKKARGSLKILQANVRKSGAGTETALRHAEVEGADVVLLQEPRVWWSDSMQVWVPRSWPTYEAFLPEGHTATEMPRVVTYVARHRRDLRIVQRLDLLGESTPDLLVLEAQGVRGPPLRIVNVYNAPSGQSNRPGLGVRVLTRQQLGGDRHPTLVAGDFNAHHQLWSAAGSWDRVSPASRRLANWIQAGHWQLGLEEGSVTRRGTRGEQDTAIDLVLLSAAMSANGWGHDCSVRPDLTTGSDHLPVVCTLQPRDPAHVTAATVRPLNMKRTDWDLFDRELKRAVNEVAACAARAAAAAAGERERLLDAAFVALQGAIKRALEVSTPRCKASARGCEWWDSECDAAVRRLQLAEVALVFARAEGRGERRAQRHVAKLRKELARRVAKSKRSFFDARLNGLEGDAIFGAMRWSDGASRRYRSPPMRAEDGGLCTTGAQKMALLRRVLLPKPEPVAMQLPDLSEELPHTVPAVALGAEELREAIFGQAPNKAAGPDEITFAVVRRAWTVMAEEMLSLFSQALEVGWHPRPLRSATLVALQKAGKRDPSAPRSYRLIALLPTLGKTLEKVVATRLARLGLEKGWIVSEQFGSIPGRSTTDAVLTLVHDIEAGWTYSPPMVTTVLTVDVRGAYDAVHWVRLVSLLYDLGAPLHLLRWLVGFLTERSACLRLDGETGAMEAVETGIPQGSPVSPVLYVLFAATLHHLFGPRALDPELRLVRLISYVDDNLLYALGASAAENTRLLKKAYEAAHRWASCNGMSFDADKRDFIHFVAPRHSPERPRAIELLDGTVPEVRAGGSFRWLGVWLDSKLAFHAHVDAMAQKGRKAAGAMTMLMNTRKGMRVMDARRLYVACVRAVMTHASAVWWRGFTRIEPGRPHLEPRRLPDGTRGVPPPDPPTLKTNPGAKKHAKQLDSVQHFALCRVLPAFRTTSRTAAQVEASCPPMDIFLDATLDAAALRIASLDAHHPLLQRASFRWAAEDGMPAEADSWALPPPVEHCSDRDARARPFSTRLDHLAARVPQDIERAVSLQQGLSEHSQVRFEDWTRTSTLRESTRAQDDGQTLNVFTDGSLLTTAEGQRVTGAGWVLAQGKQILERHRIHTGADREVFDAEAIALKLGTEAGLAVAARLGLRQVAVHTDNQAVLSALRTMRMRSSFAVFAAMTIRCSTFLADHRSIQISFRWVKGHAGLIGNEAADEQAGHSARRETNGIRVHPHAVSLATARRRAKEHAQEMWALRWETEWRAQMEREHPSVYFQHRLAAPTLRPSPLLAQLPRSEFALLLHLRTGHGDFAEYHARFAHEDALVTCICGSRFTRTHPLECEAFAPHHPLLANEAGQRLSMDELLGTPQGALALLAFARASRAFTAHKRRAVR